MTALLRPRPAASALPLEAEGRGLPLEAGAAGRVAAYLIGLAAATAGVVAVAAAGPARELLGFTFPGVEDRLSEVVSILANNLRVLAAVFVACAAAQLSRSAPNVESGRVVVLLCDGVLAVVAAWHALLVGAGVGAYGGRMLATLVPHGPVELAAYSLALGLYVTARRERLERRRWLAAGAASAIGLLLAAVLEVYVTP
jgi:hypothetical protein